MAQHESAPAAPPTPSPKLNPKVAVAGLISGLVAGGVGIGIYWGLAPADSRGLLFTIYGAFVFGGLLFGALYDPLLKPVFRAPNETMRALTILLLGWALFFAVPLAIGLTPPPGIPLATDLLTLLVETRPASLGITFGVFLLAGLLFGLLYGKVARKGEAPAPPPA